MLKFILVVLLLVVPVVSGADIYQRIDEEGILHLTDNPEGEGWKLFAPSIEKPAKKTKKSTAKQPAPIPGKYLYKEMSAGDGSVYAVKQTNIRGVYYWYMGPYGNYQATCKKGTILLDGGVAKVYVQNGEVVFDAVLSRNIWLDGTIGYEMYNITVRHAASH